MAVTKIHAIKTTLKKAIAYIENPDKTDEEVLISGYNVDPFGAALDFEITAIMAEEIKGNNLKIGGSNNLAYHMIQSFSPDDNVTPQQAHDIGKKLASEFLEGKYEYVISTHIDKGHIHNHIIFNSVSFYDYKKIHTQPYKTASKIRAISDRICAEHNLSVIKEPQGLGYSHTEYSARKQNTSWKSEIRKRLNFILDKATDFQEFKKYADELGITIDDTGKHIKFKLVGQERWSRGNKLSDNNKYTKEGICSILNENCVNQRIIKEAIKNAAKKANDYNQFISILKNEGNISIIKSKAGLLIYKINDVDEGTVKENVLGLAYSENCIKTAIYKRSFEFMENTNKSILQEEYNKTIRSQTLLNDTEILLTDENIDKVTMDGLLINAIDNKGNKGKVFIDNKHINFNEQNKEYSAFIGSQYDYYFVTNEVNPDLTESEQLSGNFIKGETLLRNLELLNKVKPIEVQILAEDIKYLGDKGIALKMADLGIENLVIDNKYVSYEHKNCSSLKAIIYPNWNYQFNGESNKNYNQFNNIDGRKLIKILQSREETQSLSLSKQIEAIQHKNRLIDTKRLAEALFTIRKENINQMGDFENKIEELMTKSNEMKDLMKTLDEKNMQYQKAAKYLITFNEYLPIKQELATHSVFTRKKFAQKYESELKAFEFAVEKLENMKVNSNVDPDKVLNLVKEQGRQVSEVNLKFKHINVQIEKIREVKKLVEELQHGEQSKNKLKNKSHEMEL
nr:relaxase/mobilization nuclease domain-containing protein [uncultured Aminipila sp.]